MWLMRIFVAGATGILGARILPMLIEAGHEVFGMTRSEENLHLLSDMGAQPVLCDVYDIERLTRSVVGSRSDLIIDQLTDLPDDVSNIPDYAEANNRIRIEGTGNLLSAAEAAGHPKFIAQSVAWTLPEAGDKAAREMEKKVLAYGGTVFRYGQLYGPGTFHERDKPSGPRIHVDRAAEITVELMHSEKGIVEIVENKES